jgi:hypothetical protein
MNYFIAVICIALLPVVLFFGVLWIGKEYDRHPKFAKFLRMEGRAFYPYQGDEDITPEYRDQVPGGWDDTP